MDRIWAPWRIEFILNYKKESCFLCDYPREDNDDINYIVHRGKGNFIILNTFPYNPGHVMVAPYRHIDKLEDLTQDEAQEHFELVRRSVMLLRKVLNPNGFNAGINLGKVAGAGIDDHIHSHIVPRWQGDSNFMPVVADTKVLPESLAETYKHLKDGLPGIL